MIGGTNDLLNKRPIPSKLVFNKIARLAIQCKVVCLSIPYIKHNYEYNKRAYDYNCSLYNYIVNLKEGRHCFVDVNACINEKDKIKSGLYMSFSGKQKLFSHVMEMISQDTVQRNNFGNFSNSNLIRINCTNSDFTSVPENFRPENRIDCVK